MSHTLCSFLQLQRFGSAPLGLVLEGGSDSPLNYIFIQSIAFGSPAFNSGRFKRGDQLVMVGSECLIGMSLLQAKRVLEEAPSVVELVAQRKESAKQSPPLTLKVEEQRGTSSSTSMKTSTPEREGGREDEAKKREEKSREEQLTRSLTVPEEPRRKVSRSISHGDMSGFTTSLGYALASTSLNTSWNVTMPGIRFYAYPFAVIMLTLAALHHFNSPLSQPHILHVLSYFTEPLRSKTTSIDNLRGSVESLGDNALYHHTVEDTTPVEQTRPAEEEFVVELHRDGSHKLGLSIVGGADNPSLQTVHVSV